MGYKHIIHKDPEKEESIWICTSHFHELFVGNPDSLQYIDISHLSGKFNEPLTVLFAGYGKWGDVRLMERNGQEGIFGIEFVREGNLLLIKDRKKYLVEKGDVYFYRDDFPDADCIGPDGYLSKYYLWFTGTIHEALLHSLNLWKKNSFHLEEPEVFETLMRRILRLMAKNPPDVDFQVSSLVFHLLLFLGRSIRQPLPQLMKNAIAFIHQNLENRIEIKDICSNLEINEIYLRRLFLKYMKLSPIKYILEQKLIWSANLLSTTSISIKEIAYMVGYIDPFYFSNQFKKYFSISPSQYRDTNKLI